MKSHKSHLLMWFSMFLNFSDYNECILHWEFRVEWVISLATVGEVVWITTDNPSHIMVKKGTWLNPGLQYSPGTATINYFSFIFFECTQRLLRNIVEYLWCSAVSFRGRRWWQATVQYSTHPRPNPRKPVKPKMSQLQVSCLWIIDSSSAVYLGNMLTNTVRAK